MYRVVFVSNTICLIISIFSAIMMVRQKISKQQQTALISAFFMAIIAFGYWFQVQSKDLSSACLAQKVTYVGTSNIFYFMLLFFSAYCNIKIKKQVHIILITLNIITMSLAVTFDSHKLFYKDVEYTVINGIPKLIKHYGPGHSLFVVLLAGYTISILVMTIVHLTKKNTKKSIKSTVILFMVILFPATMYASEKIFDTDFSLVPFGLLIAEMLIFDLIYDIGIYDYNNTAQEYAYDALDDAVLAIDDLYRFKGCNIKAKELFPSLRMLSFDDNVSSLDDNIVEILVNHNMNDFSVNEKTYQPEIKKIVDKNKTIGYVVWFYDVTVEREKTEILKNYQKDLEREVCIKTAKLQEVQEKIILGFANVIESRDIVTGGHIKRTSTYINILLDGLVKDGVYSEILTPSYIEHIKLAAPLHDIGKIAVPDNILNKKGKFTLKEFEIMKKHTTLGARIIDESLSGLEDLEYYHLARELALYHHERWDGTGYPEGLADTAIPLCARIMAVVDVFDALVSERPYKKAYPVSTVYQIITNESGVQFDPLLVECFIKVRKQIEAVAYELPN